MLRDDCFENRNISLISLLINTFLIFIYFGCNFWLESRFSFIVFGPNCMPSSSSSVRSFSLSHFLRVPLIPHAYRNRSPAPTAVRYAGERNCRRNSGIKSRLYIADLAYHILENLRFKLNNYHGLQFRCPWFSLVPSRPAALKISLSSFALAASNHESTSNAINVSSAAIHAAASCLPNKIKRHVHLHRSLNLSSSILHPAIKLAYKTNLS